MILHSYFAVHFKNYFYKLHFLNIQENKFAERIKSYFAEMSILKIFYVTLYIFSSLNINIAFEKRVYNIFKVVHVAINIYYILLVQKYIQSCF